MKKYIIPVLSLALFACQSPKKPANGSKASKVSKTELDSTINQYIAEKAKGSQSAYHFQNDTAAAKLTLLKIAKERLTLKDSNQYAVEANMINADSDFYQVDFFLAKQDGKLKVTQTQLQAVNSHTNYVWAQNSAGAWYTILASKAPDSLMGVSLKDTDRFTFTYTATIPKLTAPGKIWIPVAESNKFQDVKLLSVNAPEKYKTIKDVNYGEPALYMELQPSDGGKQIVIKYQAVRWKKTPYKASSAKANKLFLKPTPMLPVGGKFAQIDNNIFQKANAKTDLQKARAIYDYVIHNMRYNKITKYGSGSSTYACDMLTGNCTDFHSLFISLARTAGIPARHYFGASINPDKNEGSMGYHCWAAFYANGEWYPVDASEGYKYDALADYYFGHNPSNRFLIFYGRDIQFNPQPKSGIIPYFVYPVLDVNGQQLKVKTVFSYKRNA